MDPPPRSLARRSVSLLHGRGPFGSNRLQTCGASSCAHRQAPLGSSVELYPIVTACRRAHVRQGQGPLPGGTEETCPSLTRRCARRLWHLAVGGGRKPAARSNKRKGPRKRRKKEKVVCGPPLTRKAPYKPYALIGPVRIWCSEASCHSSGCKSRQHRSPVDAVVISSDGKGDRPVESLEVKAPGGWETSQIRTGGRAT